MVAGLVPGVGEERPELGQPALGHQVLQRPDRVDGGHPDVGEAGLAEAADAVGDARAPDLDAEDVGLGPGGGQRDGRLADPAADLDGQRALGVVEAGGQVEVLAVDVLVGDDVAVGVRRPRPAAGAG